jgi:hypothetical protein
MAGITSTLVAGAGIVLNAYQTYQGVQQEEAAAKSAADIGAQQKMLAEQNRVAGVQVPQLGYQLAQQSGAQRTANQVQALQGAGAAAVLGGLPGVGQQGTAQDLQLAAQLDQAKYERDTFVAQQEQAMQARKVAQQNDFLSTQLQGAQMARAQGQANINAGITGAAGTLGSLAVQYEKNRPLYDQEPKDKKAIAESLRVKQEPIVSKKLMKSNPLSLDPVNVNFTNPNNKLMKSNPLQISLDPVNVNFTNPSRKYGYQFGNTYNNENILNQFDA